MGASQAVSLIQIITKVVDPGSWFVTTQPQPFNPFNMFPGLGMVGMGGMFGMMGMVGMPPPPPVAEGGPADIREANTIEFFPPALALMIRAPTPLHTSLMPGGAGGKAKGAGALGALPIKDRGDIRVADSGDVVKDPTMRIIKLAPPKKGEELDATKVWNEALAKGGIEPGLIIATADFLFESGNYKHAAEFLKANLRYGIVVRPWVYEALAVALEASNESPEEVRRARLSAVSLDPTDASGFLQAAQTMADHKQYDRALAFCRQAALLEPNLAQPYSEALAYADLGKDSKGMEWAVDQLLSRDWPVDNKGLHTQAETRVKTLSDALNRDGRKTEAEKLRAALNRLKARDLTVTLTWESDKGAAELQLEVVEPTGTVCSALRRQTTGGGVFLTSSLTEPGRNGYVAAQAFSGEYTVKVRRLWGETFGNRAKLEIVTHDGTGKAVRRLETFKLDGETTFKVVLKDGNRTELASVAPAGAHKSGKQESRREAQKNIHLALRELAYQDFSAAKPPSGFAMSPGARTPSGPPIKVGPTYRTSALPVSGAGVQFTAELKSTPGSSEPTVVLNPVFQTTDPKALSLPVIPGGS
ncbi:MAG: hypothetical protein U0793_25315, partial [Gemmataceae bacterium]